MGLIQKITFVLMTTGGFAQPEWSPCIALRWGARKLRSLMRDKVRQLIVDRTEREVSGKNSMFPGMAEQGYLHPKFFEAVNPWLKREKDYRVRQKFDSVVASFFREQSGQLWNQINA